MLKYMAIFQATHNSTLGLDPEQLKRVTCLVYKSPALESEAKAKNWLELTKKAYPKKHYIIQHCIISFDESESENVEKMLKGLIKMF